MDKHYTPDYLADLVLARCMTEPPRKAADFSAGDGALLSAIQRVWPKCKLTATDTDGEAIRRLKRKFPAASIGRCDFLTDASRKRTKVLQRATKFDLIFLNPPFSCRGGTKFSAHVNGRLVAGSRAFAFVANAMRYLASTGVLISLVPSSCLTSEVDAEFRTHLATQCDLEVIALPANAFKGCAVDVCCIVLRRKRVAQHSFVPVREDPARFSGTISLIVRGTLPMATAKKRFAAMGGQTQVVHTTDLRSGTIHKSGLLSKAEPLNVSGAVILMPRVGRPNVLKLCLLAPSHPIVLSECVVAIAGSSILETKQIFNDMKANWTMISDEYIGSCAKYITLKRLTDCLERLGYHYAGSAANDEQCHLCAA